MWRISGIKEDEWSQAEKPLLEPEDEPTTKRYVYHVPEKTAAYNRALLGEHKRRVSELPLPPPIDEDWPGQLRDGSIALFLVVLAVALCPLIMVLIWLMDQ